MGTYRVVARLGGGAKGTVYEVEDTQQGRPAALKLFAAEVTTRDPAGVQRCLLEARIAGKLNHPNCVGLLGMGRHLGTVFFAMPLLKGGSAADLLRHRGALPPREATRITRFAAMGLVAPHSMAIIHGNIKPSNILLGASSEVRVCDFGSRNLGSRVSPAAEAFADAADTAIYQSPEQLAGKPMDARSDIYSLGAVYYTLLTGRPPLVKGDSSGIFQSPATDPRTFNSAIPEFCSQVVLRAMAEDPAERQQSAAELAESLRAVADHFDPNLSRGD